MLGCEGWFSVHREYFYFLRNRALQTEFARDEGTINFSTEDIPIASLARPTNQTSNKGKRRNIVNVGCFTSSSSSAPSGLATWADKKMLKAVKQVKWCSLRLCLQMYSYIFVRKFFCGAMVVF